MYNFDPYNVLLAIATNIPQRLNTVFVLQGHIFQSAKEYSTRNVGWDLIIFIRNWLDDQKWSLFDSWLGEELKNKRAWWVEK